MKINADSTLELLDLVENPNPVHLRPVFSKT